jgi:hypothetical protein
MKTLGIGLLIYMKNQQFCRISGWGIKSIVLAGAQKWQRTFAGLIRKLFTILGSRIENYLDQA